MCHKTLIFVSYIKRSYQGRNIWDDPIIKKSQDQDQGQGQGQDQIVRQRSALQQQMVLALTQTLVLVLRFFNERAVPDNSSLITSLDDCYYYYYDIRTDTEKLHEKYVKNMPKMNS